MTDSEQMAELLARNAAMLDSMSQLLASAQEQLAHVQQLNRDLRTRTCMAQSPDQMVTVVVDGVGGLRQLSFDRDAFEHHTPASLADAVGQAVRDAIQQSSNASALLEGDDAAPTHAESPSARHGAGPPPILESNTAEEPLFTTQPEVVERPAADEEPLEAEQLVPVAAVEPIFDSDPIPVQVPMPEPAPMPVSAPVMIQDPAPPAADQSASGSQIEHVMTALSKLQSYTGIVTRVLGVRDPERAAAIAAEYQLGDTIIERTFLSTSANPAYTGDGLVRYTIDARHDGKLIGAISEDGEQFGEVVFGPGSAFRVTGKRYYPSIRGWDIALEELG
ncbi:YbaB/EbfC family nucleoid-associated protein [Kutzneria sp. CA-103260]|uniref:YbaB/EbfC family nucleoid-associated protein n=1 Tax=Kutzneria sp. CA-103260 TaxID=2802641 RepID=UPI001BA6061B|nr:YbaB/EbfC family nucleoid-associated protein [Kutzneria sp. CA-103260]QUQ70384.1 Nucleoid-associated protein YbaB [Kutzneria sp. CA-103260]